MLTDPMPSGGGAPASGESVPRIQATHGPFRHRLLGLDILKVQGDTLQQVADGEGESSLTPSQPSQRPVGDSRHESSTAEVSPQTLSDEAQRIMSWALDARVLLRLYGGYAIRYRCPDYRDWLDEMGRRHEDLDFVCVRDAVEPTRKRLAEFGYAEDSAVYVNSEGNRLIFSHRDIPLHIDVFVDVADFNHKNVLADRLHLDYWTVPLSDLLIGKLQIVQTDQKDLVDAIALLLEHPLAPGDADGISTDRVAGLCGSNWGLWRTLTGNLDKITAYAAGTPALPPGDRARLSDQIGAVRIALLP